MFKKVGTVEPITLRIFICEYLSRLILNRSFFNYDYRKEFCKKVKVRYTRTHDRSALTVRGGKAPLRN